MSRRPVQLVWKLTDQAMQTRGGTQWVVGKWNPAGVRPGVGWLCSSGFYHAYPWLDGYGDVLAVLMNPEHANIAAPRLWIAEVRGTVVHADDFCKLGAPEQRLIAEVRVPTLTNIDLTALAIHAAGLASVEDTDAEWDAWAEGWLSNRDRTTGSADLARAWASANASASGWACASASACANAWACANASGWACASASASASGWACASASGWACASASASAWAEAHVLLRDAIVAWSAGVGVPDADMPNYQPIASFRPHPQETGEGKP